MKKTILAILFIVLIGFGLFISMKAVSRTSHAQEKLLGNFEITSNKKPVSRRLGASSMPPNAQNVESLVRAHYTLDKETATAMDRLLSFAVDNKVETKTVSSKSGKFVKLQVTTDADTQRSIAVFLNSAFPVSEISAEQFSKKAGPETVSLKLPGMT